MRHPAIIKTQASQMEQSNAGQDRSSGHAEEEKQEKGACGKRASGSR